MANFSLNKLTQSKQYKNLFAGVMGVFLVGGASVALLSDGKPKRSKKEEPVNLTGIVDTSFSEANTESALTDQQRELESLKTQIKQLTETVAASNQAHDEESKNLSLLVGEAMKVASTPKPGPELAMNGGVTATDANSPWSKQEAPVVKPRVTPRVYSVAFNYSSDKNKVKPDEPYVPSGTFARAVVLGGADADAGVNGQSKNNGVMLFKLVSPGTLPNGGRSHLQGCFVTASSWGDMSSERAYVVLDKLSCAKPGEPIIDRPVTGWAFFGGKVGIKGKPLMRDSKIMAWAGVGGLLSGLTSAAQQAQSVLSLNPLGAASVVPTGNIGPYSALGGSAKASDMLSSYYIKRAEQYHPVIQVGSGNLVTIVFKDGFFLESDDQTKARERAKADMASKSTQSEYTADNNAFVVPQEILNQIKPRAELSMNGVNP